MNQVQLIQKYSTEAWDKVYKKDAISSIFDGEKDLLKFTGTRTVKIAKFSSDGLGDYQRANTPVEGDYAAFNSTEANAGTGYGYPTGDVSLDWEEFTLRCDRAKQLRIALFDDEETGEILVAATMKDFSRTKVIPEVDAYVFSTVAKLAGHVSTTAITLSNTIGYNANGPIQALNDAFLALADAEVPEEEQVILCSNAFWAQLQSTNELVRTLRQNEYKENVSFTISSYLGRDIIAVPESRFRTDIVLNKNGYKWGTNSKKIDFIVCAKSAIYHVVKYDKVKVFQPSVVQDFDGYKVNVRVYHDVFVPDNKRVAIYAHVSDGTAPTPKVLFNYDATTDVLSGVATVPGDLMIEGLYAATTAPAVGATLASIGTLGTDYHSVGAYLETGLAAGTYYLFAARSGSVVAVSTATFTVTA